MQNLRMTTLVTVAVFFLLIGTFTSVTIQGAYQVLFSIPLAYYTWKALGRGFKLPASSWLLLAFSLVALLSVLLNWSEIPKPTKNLGKIKYFLMGALGIFPVGVWLKTVSDRVKQRLVYAAAVAVAVGGGWCAWQVMALGAWKAKPLTETMRYSYGTALALTVWLGLFLHRKDLSSWLTVKGSILGLAGLAMGVFFTQARGAQGALLIALPLVMLFWNRRIGLAAILFGGLAMSFIAWNYIAGSDTQSSIKILRSANNSSDQIRRSQWAAAFIAFKERPILGWGHANFHSQVHRIKHQYDLPAKSYDDAHAHNVPLEIAAGTGLIGLLLFAGWFFTWAWECWQRGGLVRAVMMPFFVAILFEAQFEVILDANNATWISFLYAVTLASQKRYQLAFT